LRLAHQQPGKQQPQHSVADAEVKRHWPQPVDAGQVARGECGQAQRQVASELVQPHRQPAPLWPDQVDLHHHRHRPAQPLVDAQQHVGGDDPAPAGREDQQEGHRQPDQPAPNQDVLAAEAVGQRAREQVDQGLDHAEADDEADDDGVQTQAEGFGAQQRHDGALKANHAADKGVDQHQQRELRQVGAQAKLRHDGRAGARHASLRR
jgi:hypothetical protein